MLQAEKYTKQTNMQITSIVNQAKQDAEDEMHTDTAKILFSKNKNSVEPFISRIKIYLFYSGSCTHCHKFYPIWKQTKELFNKHLIECAEYESVRDAPVFKQYKIQGVPTIVVIKLDNTETQIQGEIGNNEFITQLRNLGVPVSIREPFADYITAAQIESENSGMRTDDPDCPYISFYEGDKNYYCASSNYLNGCVNASHGSNTTPFDGAYAVVSAYLTSLPDSSLDKKKKCMAKHTEILQPWGLCDPARLAQKKSYSNDIAIGLSKERVHNTKYADNKDVVDAVLYGCNTQPVVLNYNI